VPFVICKINLPKGSVKLVKYLRGQKISQAPSTGGIYSWYYKPRLDDQEDVVRQLESIFQFNSKIETKTYLRYGMYLYGATECTVKLGSRIQPIKEIINELENLEKSILLSFLHDERAITFSRPLYIGVAKNLRKRIYDQHYTDLLGFWSQESPVSKYLNAHPNANVESVMKDLSLPHSFALEARVRNISPNDLSVYFFELETLPEYITENEPFDSELPARAIERILQLLADPVCGRK